MPRSTVGYGVVIRRSTGPYKGWVHVTLRKWMWTVGVGSRSRVVAQTSFLADGLAERDVVEGALRELLRAYCDELG